MLALGPGFRSKFQQIAVWDAFSYLPANARHPSLTLRHSRTIAVVIVSGLARARRAHSQADIEIEKRVGRRASREVVEIQVGLDFADERRWYPEAPLRQHVQWRGRRERASECAKRGALEFRGMSGLARGIWSRESGRASGLARAEATVTGRGCRAPGALGAPRTLETEKRVGMRVSGSAFDGQGGLGFTTSGRRSPDADVMVP